MLKWGLLFAIFALTGCEQDYASRVSEIEDFFSDERTGAAPDYFLVKAGLAGPDRVAVVFGFLDDGDFCNEIAELYMSRYPSDTYYCQPANF